MKRSPSIVQPPGIADSPSDGVPSKRCARSLIREQSMDTEKSAISNHPPAPVGFGEAFRYWLKLGFISFGGPTGQDEILAHDWDRPGRAAEAEEAGGQTVAKRLAETDGRGGLVRYRGFFGVHRLFSDE